MEKHTKSENKVQRTAVKWLVVFFAVMVGFTVISRAAASFLVPRVVVEMPIYQSIRHSVSAEGTLSVKQEIAVVTEPDLLIEQICVDTGQKIEEGETIAVLNMERLKEKRMMLEEELEHSKKAVQKEAENQAVALKRAKEDYEMIKAQNAAAVGAAESALNEAEAAYNSYQNMLGGREVSEEEYRQSISLLEDKKAKQEAYRLAVENQEAAVRNAERAIEDAQRADGKTEGNYTQNETQIVRYRALEEAGGRVTAPKTGIITEIYGQVGQKTTDTAFCKMADFKGGLCYTALISKEDAKYIEPGAAVTLKKDKESVENLAVKTMKAKEDGSIAVTVDVEGTEWIPGESVEFLAEKQTKESGLTVPLSAIHVDNGKNYLFIVMETNTVIGKEKEAVRIDVTVKDKNSSVAMIASEALSASSKVITDCDRLVVNGSKVRLWER